jgi:hypothetical protein
MDIRKKIRRAATPEELKTLYRKTGKKLRGLDAGVKLATGQIKRAKLKIQTDKDTLKEYGPKKALKRLFDARLAELGGLGE